ncbi:MAG: hypothetical protein ABIA11_03055 [Patescibacteria group bacterium]|nr:hypothetical protein [Patescibacteria group bacterium]
MYNYGPYDIRAFRNERKSILIPKAVVAAIAIFLVSLIMLLLGVSHAWIIGIAVSMLGLGLVIFLVLNLLIKNHQLEHGGD